MMAVPAAAVTMIASSSSSSSSSLPSLPQYKFQYTVPGLFRGTHYSIRVMSINMAGRSMWSHRTTAATFTTAPAAPAPPPAPSLSGRTATVIGLEWPQPRDHGGAGWDHVGYVHISQWINHSIHSQLNGYLGGKTQPQHFISALKQLLVHIPKNDSTTMVFHSPFLSDML
jgi:hypothetical protein